MAQGQLNMGEDTINRFFTAPELIEAYRLPRHIHDQLFAEVVPVEKTDQGEPLFLEAHVDAWLYARYSVALWRSGCGIPSTAPHITKVHDENAFVTVAEAQLRYLCGERSKRWWYRMAETGKIAYHRVGDSILFRTDDSNCSPSQQEARPTIEGRWKSRKSNRVFTLSSWFV
jgi:hypothetical protein